MSGIGIGIGVGIGGTAAGSEFVGNPPTTVGAVTTLAAELADLEVGIETVIDLRNILISPASYTLTFTANPVGAIDGDGYTWRWTPSFAEWQVYGNGNVDFVVTATDQFGQVGTASYLDGSIAIENEAPQYGDVTLTHRVPQGLPVLLLESGDALLLEDGTYKFSMEA